MIRFSLVAVTVLWAQLSILCFAGCSASDDGKGAVMPLNLIKGTVKLLAKDEIAFTSPDALLVATDRRIYLTNDKPISYELVEKSEPKKVGRFSAPPDESPYLELFCTTQEEIYCVLHGKCYWNPTTISENNQISGIFIVNGTPVKYCKPKEDIRRVTYFKQVKGMRPIFSRFDNVDKWAVDYWGLEKHDQVVLETK